MSDIPIVLDMPLLLNHNIRKYITWNPIKIPHFLVTGSTGSGKSYFTVLLLGKLALYQPDMELFIADYKNSTDYEFASGKESYYVYKDCSNGLNTFYDRFIQRLNKSDMNRHGLYLMLEEYAAFLNSQDKKMADHHKSQLADILMMGRSLNVHVIVALQRADADFFKSSRDNFGLRVLLGNASAESFRMMFPSQDIQPISEFTKGTGKGYLSDSNGSFFEIIVPTITDKEKLYKTICNVMK